MISNIANIIWSQGTNVADFLAVGGYTVRLGYSSVRSGQTLTFLSSQGGAWEPWLLSLWSRLPAMADGPSTVMVLWSLGSSLHLVMSSLEIIGKWEANQPRISYVKMQALWKLKCITLSERSQSDCDYKVSWKRQKIGDSKKISGFQGLGGQRRMSRRSVEEFQGSENTLYDTIMVDTCRCTLVKTQNIQIQHREWTLM